jgi:hypothetical protein
MSAALETSLRIGCSPIEPLAAHQVTVAPMVASDRSHHEDRVTHTAAKTDSCSATLAQEP